MTNTNRPLPYADDVETIPVDEAEDIQRVVQALELILARSQAKSGQFRRTCMSKRMATPKGNSGCCRTYPTNLPRDSLGTTGSTRQWFGFPTRPARPSPMQFRTGAVWRSRCWEWKETWCWRTSRGAPRRIS